jgi:hypothetical protein
MTDSNYELPSYVIRPATDAWEVAEREAAKVGMLEIWARTPCRQTWEEYMFFLGRL